jgi:hypothetical protein
MTMLDEVGALIDANFPLTLATDLFLGDSPMGGPDSMVTIVETSGLAPLFAHDISGVNVEQPTFQVYCRANTYVAARAQAEGIFILLNQQVNTTLSGTFYPRIASLQSPFSIGRDDNHRAQVVCNYGVRKGLT